MNINWKDEIEKARAFYGQNDCCQKLIELSVQIANELEDTKSDVDYYREKAIDYLERSAGLTRSFAKDCVGDRKKGDYDDQTKGGINQ